MFGKGDIVKQYVRNFWIDYIEIPGTSYANADERFTFRMPEQENIWESYQAIYQRLRLYVDNPFTAGPDGFAPDDNSQLYCLREGLVNFCAHADYFSPMHPTVRKFDNRIEFQNPGSFIVSIDVVKNKNASFPRNPTIINLFRYVKLSESAGYGIDKIMKWEDLTRQTVDFETNILYSTITYYLTSSGQKGGQKQDKVDRKGRQKGGEVDRKGRQNSQEEILRLIREDRYVTTAKMAETIGIHRSAVAKHLKKLRETGTVRRVGSDKGGWWEIIT